VKYAMSVLVGMAAVVVAVAAFTLAGWIHFGGLNAWLGFDARYIMGAFPKTTLAVMALIFAFAFRWSFRR